MKTIVNGSWLLMLLLSVLISYAENGVAAVTDSPMNRTQKIVQKQQLWVTDGKVSFKPPDTVQNSMLSVSFNDFRPFFTADSRVGSGDLFENSIPHTFTSAIDMQNCKSDPNSSKTLNDIQIDAFMTHGRVMKGQPDSMNTAYHEQDSSSPINKENYIYYPDLVLHSWAANPHPIIEGSRLDVTGRVLNNGWGAAGASHVALYLSVDGDTNLGDDAFVGKKSVVALNSGYYQDQTWSFNFPDLGSGTYTVWLYFLIDCDNQVAETNESNLFWSDALSVIDQSVKADLAVYQFLWTPETATEGAGFTMYSQVYNKGQANSNPGRVSLYLSSDASFNHSVHIGSVQVPALAPLASVWAQWDFLFPDLGSGTYQVWIGARVDADNQTEESDENNFFICNNTLYANENNPLPDLEGPYFWYQNLYANEGEAFWVGSCVYNVGGSVSPPSHVRAYLSTDNDYDTSDDYDLGKKAIVSLFPNYYQQVRWDFTFPDLGSGTYPVYLLVSVDCDFEVEESDETNNLYKSMSCIFGIEPYVAKPDIQVDSLAFHLTQADGRNLAKSCKRNTDYFKNKTAPPAELNDHPGPLRYNTNHPDYVTGKPLPADFAQIIAQYSEKISSIALETENLAASIDWSQYDTGHSGQGACGSCWAFASTAMIENLVNQLNYFDFRVNLSEQTVLACTGPVGTHPNDCGGGLERYALQTIKEMGIPQEDCYTYEETDGYCSLKCDMPEYEIFITGYDAQMWDWPNENTVNEMRKLLQTGPMCCGLVVYQDFVDYNGGIYRYDGFSPKCSGHAVLVVGYNDSQRYFKIKNSWAPHWGESGYGYISYDCVTDGHVFFGWDPTQVSKSDIYIKDYSSERRTILVENVGDAALEISKIEWDRSWLSCSDNFAGELLPGERTGISFAVNDWSAIGSDNRTATLKIYSNDPDESPLAISIQAGTDPGLSDVVFSENFDTWQAGNTPPVNSGWTFADYAEGNSWKIGNLTDHNFSGINSDNVNSLFISGYTGEQSIFDWVDSPTIYLPNADCWLEFWVCIPSDWAGNTDYWGFAALSYYTENYDSSGYLWQTLCEYADFSGWKKISVDMDECRGLGEIYLSWEFMGQSSYGFAVDEIAVFTGSSMHVSDANVQIPENYRLSIYPNPFNAATHVEFDLTQQQDVNLCVYNINGQLVTTLLNGPLSAGSHKVRWDAADYPTGVYFIRLASPNVVMNKKCILIK